MLSRTDQIELDRHPKGSEFASPPQLHGSFQPPAFFSNVQRSAAICVCMKHVCLVRGQHCNAVQAAIPRCMTECCTPLVILCVDICSLPLAAACEQRLRCPCAICVAWTMSAQWPLIEQWDHEHQAGVSAHDVNVRKNLLRLLHDQFIIGHM